MHAPFAPFRAWALAAAAALLAAGLFAAAPTPQRKTIALDAKIDLKPGIALEDLLKSMQGHVLAKGQTIGTFQIK